MSGVWRRAGAVLCCSLVAGACSSDSDRSNEQTSATASSRVTATTGVVPTESTHPTDQSRPATDASGGAGSSTTSPRTPQTTTTAAAEATSAPMPTGSGAVGSYARTLLRPSPSPNVAIEVIGQAGEVLEDATMSHLTTVLGNAAEKPVSSSITAVDDAQAPSQWDEGAIVGFADRHGRVRATTTTAVLYVLALPGRFGPDERAIGVAVRGDVVAIFVDLVTGAATPLVSRSSIEKAVAVHELGHVLGLVDIVIDRDRADPRHPFHSRNRGSVMFWAIETDLVGQVLDGPPPNSFDAEDRADLTAIRNGR